MTEASTKISTAPFNSVPDAFTTGNAGIAGHNSTKTTAGFAFGSGTTATADKSDDNVTKPVTPVSEHSPDHHNSNSNESADYVVSAPSGDAAAASTSAETTSAHLNPTGVFSNNNNIPGLGLAKNAATDASEKDKDKDGAAEPTTNSTSAVGEKRKADDIAADDDAAGGSVRSSLKATVEDADGSGAEREPDAKKAKTDMDPTSAPAPEPATAVSADKPSEANAAAEKTAPEETVTETTAAEKTAPEETVTETTAAEKTEKTAKKPGRPKKGTAPKKASAPVGATARKTRSQGPVN